jgi:hypothetical protein
LALSAGGGFRSERKREQQVPNKPIERTLDLALGAMRFPAEFMFWLTPS